MNEDALSKPTFSRFIALLDNYETSTGLSETVTPEEVKENQLFIDSICETKVLQLLFTLSCTIVFVLLAIKVAISLVKNLTIKMWDLFLDLRS